MYTYTVLNLHAYILHNMLQDIQQSCDIMFKIPWRMTVTPIRKTSLKHSAPIYYFTVTATLILIVLYANYLHKSIFLTTDESF
jgi:hypothetical protein